MLKLFLGGGLLLIAAAAALLLFRRPKPEAGVAVSEKPPVRDSGLRAVMRCVPGHTVLRKFDYGGIRTCRAAAELNPTSCAYACLGYGDCVSACPRGAIIVEHGCAKVRPELCIGCGSCASACPRQLLTLLPKDRLLQVTCASEADAETVQKVCETGCTGCGLCVQTCQVGAIRMEGNLAVLDAEKCTDCGDCVRICPRKIIQTPGQLPAIPEVKPAEKQVTYSVMEDTLGTREIGTWPQWLKKIFRR